MFSRKCPECNIEIFHTNEDNRNRLEREHKLCKSCGILKMKQSKIGKKLNHLNFWYHRESKYDKLEKSCPVCGKFMIYSRSDSLLRSIKNNSICNSCSTIKYKKSWNNVITQGHRNKMAATKAGFDTYEEYLENSPEWKRFKNKVHRLTRKQDLSNLPNNDKLRGLNGTTGAYQIDHIISVSKGFKMGMTPEQIADVSNLQIIPWEENITKNNK